MFKRENRLIPGIKFNNSRLFTAPQFILKEKENGLKVNRFGIVVSKKIDKRAVVRNNVKRFYRETILSLKRKTGPGHDILLIIKEGTIDNAKGENALAVRNAFEKVGLI